MEKKLVQIFSENIRIYRDSRGLTQLELAELCGLHRNYIVELEQGKRNITLGTLEKLSKALEVSPRKLVDEQLYK